MQSNKCHPNSLPQLHLPLLERGVQLLDFEGARIAYDFEPATETTKPPTLLLFINGFQRNRLDFRAIRRRLHKNNPTLATLAFDNRGVGETTSTTERLQEIPPEYRIVQMARDATFLAESFARTMGLSHYATLGFSMGGMIAMSAAANGANISKLILVSTSAERAPRTDTERERHSWPSDEAEMQRYVARYFGRRFAEGSPLVLKSMAKAMLVQKSHTEGETHIKWQSEAVHSFNFAEALPQVTCPTLVLCGGEDRITPPEHSRFISEQIPNAQLQLYAEKGHLLLMEAPDRLQHDVESFLKV